MTPGAAATAAPGQRRCPHLARLHSHLYLYCTGHAQYRTTIYTQRTSTNHQPGTLLACVMLHNARAAAAALRPVSLCLRARDEHAGSISCGALARLTATPAGPSGLLRSGLLNLLLVLLRDVCRWGGSAAAACSGAGAIAICARRCLPVPRRPDGPAGTQQRYTHTGQREMVTTPCPVPLATPATVHTCTHPARRLPALTCGSAAAASQAPKPQSHPALGPASASAGTGHRGTQGQGRAGQRMSASIGCACNCMQWSRPFAAVDL